MRTIAFVTYCKQPALNKSDNILARELARNHYAVEAIPWDKKMDWSRFDSVVVRSCWDYHTRHREFLAWLDLLEQMKVRVWNSVQMMRWNSHKSYLFDLQKKGIQIPPTKLVHKNQLIKLQDVSPWETTIIKPAIGASAVNVMKVERPKIESCEKHFQQLLQDGDIILQQYIKEIETIGEISFIFFGTIYSHAILKKPGKGGHLAHPRYGGTVELYQPTDQQIRQANNVLMSIDQKTLYARVDGLMVNDTFVLMELELIEPLLFIDSYPSSAQLFAQTYERMTG